MQPGLDPASSPVEFPDARAGRAWFAAAVWGAFVLWLGGQRFAASATSQVLVPLLHWFLPGLSGTALVNLALLLRKIAHPVVYGVLAVLALRAWRLTLPTTALRVGLLACATALAVAGVDESRQFFEPGRTASPWDVALDGTGAAAAVTGALLVWRWRARTRPRAKRVG